ncbi:uncharacterized protein BJ212DRAFT_1296953 [Suillus subaureus]|uniref:Uncharacterized protein n=1 Tax=Suillus subaureus TaxID=48587 RepID=A0A9P7EI66_9AGAM|nr:uncharacterized protein BJ212DRAFT_1296953 [Suillus subaureus]KAG1821585.1 hypothetical protein BJ212DRAFT_1296953 [Suillus subaureus]
MSNLYANEVLKGTKDSKNRRKGRVEGCQRCAKKDIKEVSNSAEAQRKASASTTQAKPNKRDPPSRPYILKQNKGVDPYHVVTHTPIKREASTNAVIVSELMESPHNLTKREASAQCNTQSCTTQQRDESQTTSSRYGNTRSEKRGIDSPPRSCILTEAGTERRSTTRRNSVA